MPEVARTGREERSVPEVVALAEQVRRRLARHEETLTPEGVAAALRAEGRPVGDATVLGVLEVLHRDLVGAGPLQPLLSDPRVTDVLVNGPHRVYVDRGCGLELTEVRFADDGEVRRLAQRLAGSAGRRLDDASPYVDLRLPGGARMHAVLAPLAAPGSLVSLRVPHHRVLGLPDLVSAGSFDERGRRLLERVMRRRLAFVVSGGTGSGKTTLLNAMLAHVPPRERLVVVEDTAELRPDHPHVVALEARQPNVEGVGEVGLRVLVRQALRMRPDRIVVGEVRGAEVVDLLAALNTGHEGGCGTVHANSAAAVPERLEGLALAAGLPSEAAHSQIATALDLVLHCGRGATGARRLEEVAVVVRDRGRARAVPALRRTGEELQAQPQGAPLLADLLSGSRRAP